MWYRIIGCLVTLAILVAPLATDAQPTRHSRRIGWLLPAGPPSGTTFEAFLHSLRDMGYVEGQNLVIEVRHGEGKAARLPTLAAELVGLPVAVLVTSGTPATRAARDATSTIPIVFAGVADPVDQGLIASWTQPGGHITGVASASVEFNTGKQLELLKELVPATTRVAVLVTPDHPLYGAALQKLQAAAQLLRMDLHLMDVREPATDLDRAFAALAHERVDALCMLGDPAFIPYRTRIVELVAASRLPAIYGLRGFVEAGGLMSDMHDLATIHPNALVSWWAKSCMHQAGGYTCGIPNAVPS